MSSPIARLLVLICAALAVVPATAGAAGRTTTPKVKSVSPMKLKIGDRLTIKGSGFLKGKNRNTVVFKAAGQRAVFVKAQSASSTKLVVKVPAKLVSFLKVRSGQSVATRFQLRVLARKLSKAYTPAKGSPVIAPATARTPAKTATPAAAAAAPAAAPAPPADCDRDGTPDAADGDDDNDLLPDATEAQLRTGVCNADSDGDGMEDGWEYQSARDRNAHACPAIPASEDPVVCDAAKPFPADRAYTNPLFADAASDYDGDYLPAWFEHEAWKKHGVRSLDDLWYSDGMRASQDSDGADGCRGLTEAAVTGGVDKYPAGQTAKAPGALTTTARYGWLYGQSAYSLDIDGAGHPNFGCLDDSERDEDGDFLSNAQELTQMMSGPAYVHALFAEPDFKTLWEGTEPLNADTDGDKILDGLDDEDHDGFWNVEEIKRGSKSADDGVDTTNRTGLWVDPYNPCVPAILSDGCPRGVLITGTVWRPFVRDGDDLPDQRWPLYADPYPSNSTELWDGVPDADQVLPMNAPGTGGAGLEHPLLPRPS
jgi:hypothetical protein